VLARVLRLLLHSSPLSLGDRALGALFGGLRGLLLLLVLTQVVGMTPLYESQAWRDSIAAPWLMSVVALIKPLLPSQISQYLPA
jgi:membrane protein required for colicin V production